MIRLLDCGLLISSQIVNPKYEAVVDAAGKITDVKVTYDEGYAEQMLRYSKDYSNLPSINN